MARALHHLSLSTTRGHLQFLDETRDIERTPLFYAAVKHRTTAALHKAFLYLIEFSEDTTLHIGTGYYTDWDSSFVTFQQASRFLFIRIRVSYVFATHYHADWNGLLLFRTCHWVDIVSAFSKDRLPQGQTV